MGDDNVALDGSLTTSLKMGIDFQSVALFVYYRIPVRL